MRKDVNYLLFNVDTKGDGKGGRLPARYGERGLPPTQSRLSRCCYWVRILASLLFSIVFFNLPGCFSICQGCF